MEVWEKTVLIVFCIILVIFSFIIVFRQNGVIQLNVKKRQMVESSKQNDIIKEKNEKLCREIKRLKSDSDYIESVARKELGMIREDEIIIRFHPKKSEKK